MKKNGIKSWSIEDERRAYSSRNPYHKGINNLENIQKVISYRILDIIKKLKVHAQILVIHCTEYEDLFSEKYFDKKECTTEIIRNHNINEFVNNYENIIQRNKYDIILFELPVGLKRPNPDDLIHDFIHSKLSKFGVALNVSTQISFGKRIYDKYPNSLRHRQNILGNILRYASVSFSLYEFLKYSKNIE